LALGQRRFAITIHSCAKINHAGISKIGCAAIELIGLLNLPLPKWGYRDDALNSLDMFANMLVDRSAQSIKSTPSMGEVNFLGYHPKSGHTLSLQNRPTGVAEDVTVLPCRRVRLQGAD
jgi:hypothetical protein